MGRTDKQFSGFLRMVIARLRDVLATKEPEAREEKLRAILDDLQSTLED